MIRKFVPHLKQALPFLIAGLVLKYLMDWQAPFADKWFTELIILLISCFLGYIFGGLFKKRNWIRVSSIVLIILVWYFGQMLILELSTWNYYAWNIILLIAFTVGSAIRIQVATPFQVSHLLITLAGFVIGYSGYWIIWIFPVFILLLANTQHFATSTAILLSVLAVSSIFAAPLPTMQPSQEKYEDWVLSTANSRKSSLNVTKWRNNYWFYVNNQNRVSSLDEWLYHEPMVHPAFLLNAGKDILLIGGETGGSLKEILKYDIDQVDHLLYDKGLKANIESNKFFKGMVGDVFKDDRVTQIDHSIFKFLNKSKKQYDLIIIDLPDPTSLEVNQYYTLEFYSLCRQHLSEHGVLVTQTGSPYFATKAFYTIKKTMEATGYATIPFHNQILTAGEWGWIIGSPELAVEEMKKTLETGDAEVATKWFNNEAMQMMMSFGKITQDTSGISVNTVRNPVLHQYYTQGNWTFE